MKKCASYLLVFVLFVLVASISYSAELSYGNIKWDQAKGETINVLMCAHHYTESLKTKIPEFEKLTGIKVKLTDYAEGEYFKKVMIDLSLSKPATDVLMINNSYVNTYATGGWVAPLDPYLNDPKLTDAKWYNFADFSAGLNLLMYKDQLYGIPITIEPQILFYRKDIFQEKGLSVPQTMDELYQTAKKINSDEIAGIALRLTRGQGAWWPWSGFLATYKGTWVDENRVPHLNSPNAIKATEMYIKLNKDAGPADVMNYGWYEVLSNFQQGKVAMIIDASSFIGQFEDKEKSAVAGKVGCAVIPAGPDGYRQPAGGASWSLGISAKGGHQKAAWLFVEWATSSANDNAIAIDSGNIARNSTWDNEEFKAKYPYPDWVKASADSNIKYSSDWSFPQVKEFAQLVDIMDITLQNIYSGKPAIDAMEEAQQKTIEALK